MRLGFVVVAMLLTACGGEGGITVSGPMSSLTDTEACFASGGPDAEAGDETCYRIETSSEVGPDLGPGDFVTLRASDGVVLELTKVEGPE